MAATSESPHLPALGAADRREIGRELEATLLELVDLSLLGRQLHWSVTGPRLLPLHRSLDRLVVRWTELSDALAERAVAIGYWPDAQAEAIASGPEHTAVTRGAIEDQAVVLLLVESLGQLASRTRARLGRLGELDPVSQDLMITVLAELERQLWMSRAQLPLGE